MVSHFAVPSKEGPTRFDKSDEKLGISMERSGQGLHFKHLILLACDTTGSPTILPFLAATVVRQHFRRIEGHS
jgi:hypothetical protein